MTNVYTTLRVWVEVEAAFTEGEVSAPEPQFLNAVAERIASGNVDVSVVKFSTVLP